MFWSRVLFQIIPNKTICKMAIYVVKQGDDLFHIENGIKQWVLIVLK